MNRVLNLYIGLLLFVSVAYYCIGYVPAGNPIPDLGGVCTCRCCPDKDTHKTEDYEDRTSNNNRQDR